MADPQHRTVIADIDVPFTRLVAFFVKAALAAIPATLIVWVILAVTWFILASVFGITFRPDRAW